MIMHKDLTPNYWFKFSLLEQLSNIGTDAGRAIKWKSLGKEKDGNCVLMRAIELLSPTIADPKNNTRLKELIGIKEELLQFERFYGKINI